MASHHPIRKTVAAPTPVIPDKLYFRIGDVARLCEVPAYVLRFWETEFPNLKPNKGGTGQRLYRRKDVETALRIKHLLYDLGYTIPGARQVFKTDTKPGTEVPATPAIAPEAAPLPEPPQSAAILSGAQSAEPKTPEAVSLDTTAAPLSTPSLHALREELRALHSQLSTPISTEPPVPPLRPLLVAAPKPKPRLEPKPDTRPALFALPDQPDLFGGE